MDEKKIVELFNGLHEFVYGGGYEKLLQELNDSIENASPAVFGHSFSSMLAELKLATKDMKRKKSIAEYINDLLKEKNIRKNSYVYEKAQLRKETFNKLKNGVTKEPDFLTLVKLAVGFELTIEETNIFLRNFNRTFNDDASVRDRVLSYAIKNEFYDTRGIDNLLLELKEEAIFSEQ